MKKVFIFPLIIFMSAALFAEPVLLRFRHKTGDSASYVSTVYEDVSVNGRLDHKAQIVNRISSQVTEVSEDGIATINASYMTTEKADDFRKTLSWGEEFQSIFKRSPRGEMQIDDSYFMPTVRNIPVFPDYEVSPGERWSHEGWEAEDLRNTFNVAEPYMVPFKADYQYVKDEKNSEGTVLNVIRVQYTLYYETPKELMTNKYMPATTMGNSNQLIYWDNEKGIIDHYTEDFKIVIENMMGDVFVFKGTSGAEVTEFIPINDNAHAEEIQQTVDQMGITDISVKTTEKGLTIALENIQFMPDSAILMESEKIKLKKIASILLNYSNDLLVTGHCADRGTEQARMQLSEERADTVADYLKKLGVRDEYHIFTSGKGAHEPVDTNDTEVGRRRNRRVEITILE